MITQSIPTVTTENIFYSKFEEICKTYNNNLIHNGWLVFVDSVIKHFPIK